MKGLSEADGYMLLAWAKGLAAGVPEKRVRELAADPDTADGLVELAEDFAVQFHNDPRRDQQLGLVFDTLESWINDGAMKIDHTTSTIVVRWRKSTSEPWRFETLERPPVAT